MPNGHQENFGAMRFLPYAGFQDPYRGLDREARNEQILEAYDDPAPRPPGLGDWPRVHTAIRRDGFFVLETATPSFTAMLHFCPGKPDAGHYEIHQRPRGGVERGRTLRLKEVPAGETDARVSMLTPFPVRYFVITGADDRARTRLVWLVGLTNFRNVDEELSRTSIP